MTNRWTSKHCQKCIRYKDYHRLEPLRDFRPMPIRDENGYFFPKHGPDYSYIMSTVPFPPARPAFDNRLARAYLQRAEYLYRDMLDLALRPPLPPIPPPPLPQPPVPPTEVLCTCSGRNHCCEGHNGCRTPCSCDDPPHRVIRPYYAHSPFYTSRVYSPTHCWPDYSHDHGCMEDCTCCSHEHSPNYCRYCFEKSLRRKKKNRVMYASSERAPKSLQIRISAEPAD
jgi:hypothetical protein